MAEKSINEIPADTRRLYTKAVEAAQRDNHDYAIALFCQILDKEPGFFECRRALRTTQLKKAGAGGGGFFKKMLSGAGSSPQIAKAKLAVGSNPAGALSTVEQVLNGDPSNASAHRIIVDAALALELPQTATLSLEVLVKNSPKDKALAIEFANTIAEHGGDARAGERVLQELIRTSPYDPDLVQALKNLSAARTLDEGGYDKIETGEASYRDILRNKEEAVSLEQEKRVQKTEDVAERLIGEYEEKLRREPNNMKIVRDLAELYAQKKDFDRSLAYYDRIKESAMGNDPTLEQAVAKTIVKRFDHELEQLNPFAPEHAEEAAKIHALKLDFQITECQKRVEKYPTDLAIRFEMGQLYFQAGKISEAIAEFQKAQGNPHKRIAAMNLLAQCFAKRKMFDLAARTLQNAIKEKPGFDEEKKELTYQLGCVFETMAKKEEAIEQFKLIYETDSSYKDVSAKVEAYYAGQ